jgi:hypothetical protein
VRSGSTVALNTGRCELDLLHYRAALRAGRDDRLRALASLRGNLCHAQFPYDDHLVDERHRLAADWQERCHELAGDDPDLLRRLEPARRALGL